LFGLILLLPSVNAQVVVTSHNITYELGEEGALVKESILFVNPENSEFHTFDGDLILLRGDIKGLAVTGVPWRVDNSTLPAVVYLEFSKRPIIRTSGDNTRIVTLSYSSSDLIREGLLDNGEKVNVLFGSVLPPLPTDSVEGSTNIKITAAEGFQFGIVLPPADVRDGTVSYTMSKEDRSIYSAFNVEVQYAKFMDRAQTNIDLVETGLDDAKRKVEDARSAILNAMIYNANTTGAEASMNEATNDIEKSMSELAFAKARMREGDYYQAYLISGNSLDSVNRAVTTAAESEREANIQLRVALNERISLLENMSVAAATPPTTPVARNETPVKEEEVIKEPETPPPSVNPSTSPPATPPVTTLPESKGLPFRGIAGVLIVLTVLVIVILTRKQGEPSRDRQAGVKDFRAISDLKRKSYKDFEEKVTDVKKETNIAGEIRKLEQERSKYEMGIENLTKKKLTGEVDKAHYNEVKGRFEGHLDRLDKKITALAKELPKKDGSDEKGKADKPKKSTGH